MSTAPNHWIAWAESLLPEEKAPSAKRVRAAVASRAKGSASHFSGPEFELLIGNRYEERDSSDPANRCGHRTKTPDAGLSGACLLLPHVPGPSVDRPYGGSGISAIPQWNGRHVRLYRKCATATGYPCHREGLEHRFPT